MGYEAHSVGEKFEIVAMLGRRDERPGCFVDGRPQSPGPDRAHRGTLNHYAGDALYAVWELSALPQANALAVEFALAETAR